MLSVISIGVVINFARPERAFDAPLYPIFAAYTANADIYYSEIIKNYKNQLCCYLCL